jgi:hypothetical protein
MRDRHGVKAGRRHIAVSGLVGAGSGPNVEDRPGKAESRQDQPGDPRVGSPTRDVPLAEPAVVHVAGEPVA